MNLKDMSKEVHVERGSVNKAEHPIDELQDDMEVIKQDPWLKPFAKVIKQRFQAYREWLGKLDECEGGLNEFAKGYLRRGFQVLDNGIMYREWAPNAESASLVGDFNGWNVTTHPMRSNGFGVWEIFLEHEHDGQPQIPHGSRVKFTMICRDTGERIYRIPAWIRRVEQNIEVNPVYEAIFWNPIHTYTWKYERPWPRDTDLRIYEAHIGIASPEGRIASYDEFRENVLPRIVRLGYNTIQLMAIMEHAYYASFGYQVTSFFAISSRFGTPEALKRLIDEAHKHGILVLLDVIHSHASSNVADGLNQFDGTDHDYFHEGTRGRHELWGSRLFNYGNWEVLRFLLSNLRWYIEEYRFDGFRFDGVTSMLYRHHGIGVGFSGDYHEYFDDRADQEAIVYLILANTMLHSIYPEVITIAEDVSGFPGLCRPVNEGGLGFDYRLAMAIPDVWIEMLKHVSDEAWDMGHLVWTLTNRRHLEKTVAYCESHDQALVGDKTIAFWLMDKEMYTNMSHLSPLTPIIDRGLALHKLIRLITYGLGGEAYLNFMGNEFGHPEWLDFPRPENCSSFHYARRQFNLVDDPLLRYVCLRDFDKAMNQLEKRYRWLSSPQAYVSLKHESDKIIVFERGHLVWIFNFHPSKSFVGYRIGVPWSGIYRISLDSDRREFGGHDRVNPNGFYVSKADTWNDRDHQIQIYLPCRTVLVLSRDE